MSMNAKAETKQKGSLFEMEGTPGIGEVLPMALQHVVAMIVGCVTPAIIVSNAASLSDADKVLMIQSALVVAALSTLLQVYGMGKRTDFISAVVCR